MEGGGATPSASSATHCGDCSRRSEKGGPRHARAQHTLTYLRHVAGTLTDLDNGIRSEVHRELGRGLSSLRERLREVAWLRHHVFMHRGLRYRVRDWDSLDDARRRGRVECELFETHQHTFREAGPRGRHRQQPLAAETTERRDVA